ncbi:hypothetical protein GY45DRAFT_1435958 [Cubamyces sp. BRFM 1775]|nr:hypothetical protein GY45DRAFT_1435958 [Cubamyces sp. BRFM 1775]
MAPSRFSKTSKQSTSQAPKQSTSQTVKASVMGKPRVHKEEAKFTCEICGAKMDRDFRRHQLMHQQEGRYKCPFEGCQSSFTQRSNLRTHINVHTGNRAHSCVESWIDEFGTIRPCPATFKDPSMLTRHRKKKHGIVSPGKGQRMAPGVPKFRSAADLEVDAKAYEMAAAENIQLHIARARVLEAKAEELTAEAHATAELMASMAASHPVESSVVSAGSVSPSMSSYISYPAPDDTFSTDFLSSLSASSSSSECYPTSALPESSYCDFSMSLAGSGLEQAVSEQAQVQNFVDVVGEADMLLPSQLPTQYFDDPLSAVDFSAVPQAWCAPQQYADASAFDGSFFPDELTEMNITMATGLGLDMGAAAAAQLNVFPGFDVPKPAAQEPLEPVAPWGAYFIESSSASSVASTPPAMDDDVFDDLFQQFCP